MRSESVSEYLPGAAGIAARAPMGAAAPWGAAAAAGGASSSVGWADARSIRAFRTLRDRMRAAATSTPVDAGAMDGALAGLQDLAARSGDRALGSMAASLRARARANIGRRQQDDVLRNLAIGFDQLALFNSVLGRNVAAVDGEGASSPVAEAS
jgi:hypothetical protein